MTPLERMVVLVAAVYVSFKALTWRPLAPARAVGYLLLWPGMDPAPFAERPRPDPLLSAVHAAERPRRGGLFLAVWGAAKMAVGAGLLASRVGVEGVDVVRVFLGIGLLVHFGLCDVLAGLWRAAGVPVERLFVNPAASRTLGEFWGRRWNLAFHAAARERFFKPVARRWGAVAGVAATFIISGLLHDLLLSIPAGGGYGLPFTYFVLHGGLVLAERRWGLGGRSWTLFWVLAPVPLLFHPWMVRALILPLI